MKISITIASMLGVANAQQYTRRSIEARQSNGSTVPLIITNSCPDTIYPAIYTNAGTGPSSTGFELSAGNNKSLTVSSNWNGRVWGRTNCTFSSQQSGSACSTGDCGGLQACTQPGQAPATLAEFNLDGANNQAYYDISLVDGYNLPMAIVLIPNGIAALAGIPPNETNPSCVGSVGNLAAQNYNPYSSSSQIFLGTNQSSQLPFDTSVTAQQVSQWCPWDLQVSPPTAPGAGVYPYPDGNIQRPAFDPCYSACVKYGDDQDCCTGQYDGTGKCSPSYYSKAAKAICPDAYSYAYDDQDSTFAVPQGGGFQVVLCPGGRSTKIISSKTNGQVQFSGHMSMGSRNPFTKGWPLIDSVGLHVLVLACFLLGFMT